MEQLLTFLVLLALGFGFGRWAEKRHYRSIHAREAILRGLIVVPDRMPPIQYQHYHSNLVTGSVVVSVDYFKTVAAGLRSFIGGRIGAYESLLDRARREAILRMQEDALRQGDRKSTRLNSSHVKISYAVFCLKKK